MQIVRVFLVSLDATALEGEINTDPTKIHVTNREISLEVNKRLRTQTNSLANYVELAGKHARIPVNFDGGKTHYIDDGRKIPRYWVT